MSQGSVAARARALRRLFSIAGVFCIVLGFGVDWIGLSSRWTFGYPQIILVFAGAALLLCTLLVPVLLGERGRSLARRGTAIYQTVALVCFNSVVLLVTVELFLRLVEVIFVAVNPHLADPHLYLPYYSSQKWGRPYWKEFDISNHLRYVPWVVWRRYPFNGEMIHVDQEGFRETPGSTCTDDAFSVYVFGGSTMWGTGARDAETIAAYLQSELSRMVERPVCVRNFGESGYVSTQAVIELLLQLRAGKRPDLVIFYDGVNEVASAYESGRAGVHENLQPIAEKFDGIGDGSLGARLLKSTAIFTFINTYVAPPRAGTEQSYRTKGVDAEHLAQQITDQYLSNLHFVQLLGKAFHFDYMFFWQPVIAFGAKPLVKDEQRIASQMDPARTDLYRATYRDVEEASVAQRNLYFMAHVFDQQTSPLWIDPYHVTPEGNELIAQAMLSVLAPRLAHN
jgi:lysophospholipase L1-like esterase